MFSLCFPLISTFSQLTYVSEVPGELCKIAKLCDHGSASESPGGLVNMDFGGPQSAFLSREAWRGA